MSRIPEIRRPKDPADTDVYALDWSLRLPTETLRPAAEITTSPPDGGSLRVLATVVDVPQSSVYALITGGRAGITYTLHCTVTTENSIRLTRSFRLPVIQR